jgi:hypothetical protein
MHQLKKCTFLFLVTIFLTGITKTHSTLHKSSMQYCCTCICNDQTFNEHHGFSLLFQTRTVTSSRNLECLHRPVQKFCPHITCLYHNFQLSKHRSCLEQNYRIHHTHWHWRHLLARNCLGVSGVCHFSMFQLHRSMLIHQAHTFVSETRQLSVPAPFRPLTDCSSVYIYHLPYVCCMTQPTSSFIWSA